MQHLQKNRGILAFLMIFSLLVSILPTNTIQAEFVPEYTPSYQDWKQSDLRWATNPIGDESIMLYHGGQITSLAILMVHAGVENESNFNPDILRERYENAGYIVHSSDPKKDGNLYDSATSKSFSPKFYRVGTHCYTTESFSEIRSDISNLIDSGYYVEVRVSNNTHSVAVKNCTDKQVNIMDPMSGTTTLSSYDGWISCTNYYKAEKKADNLTVNEYNYPTGFDAGKAFSIHGKVTSGVSNIKELTAGVYTTAGKLKTGKTVTPNARTYSLSKVDPYIYFNKLASGTYVYKVTATNSSKTETLIEEEFTVYKETITASGYNYPTKLKKGQVYSIHGTVTSSFSKIKSLTCGVYTTDGKLKTGKTVSPNARTYSLSNVDPYIYFDKLACGTYVYKVTATNSTETKTVIEKKFTVKMDTITASGYNYPTKLKKGQSYSISGTVTSNVSNIKSLTCGVYTTGGTLKFGKTVQPNAKSFDFKKAGAYILFHKLPAGTYDYKVIATNSSGTKTVIKRRFTVS